MTYLAKKLNNAKTKASYSGFRRNLKNGFHIIKAIKILCFLTNKSKNNFILK
jgi:hypothetical protein